MNFLDRSSKNAERAKLMKIRLVEADVSHMDRQKDRHHKANGRFSKFANATKYTHVSLILFQVTILLRHCPLPEVSYLSLSVLRSAWNN